MPTSHRVQAATRNQPSLLRAFHLVRDEGIKREEWSFLGGYLGRGSDLRGGGLVVPPPADALPPAPVGRRSAAPNHRPARAIRNPAEQSPPERRLVLDSSTGPTFAFGSAVLSGNAERKIDGFLGDLEGSPDSGSAASERIFVVAGYTDNVGHEDYNYELGRRRATSIAGYLVGKEGLDPTQVRVVSYGASKPVADNTTPSGRRSNRRMKFSSIREYRYRELSGPHSIRRL